MPRLQTLHDCQQQLQQVLPQLSRPLQKSLAAFVCGVVWSGSVTLKTAAATLPTATLSASSERRFQRLLSNDRLDATRAQRELSAQILARHHGRIELFLDATTTGATTQHAGVHTLLLAIAHHGRALPLAWRCWRADQSGQEWARAQEALFADLEAVRPPDTQVIIMADRGLSGAPFIRRVQAQGWHYVVRVVAPLRVHLPDGHIVPIRDLAPCPGTATKLEQVTVGAPRHKRGRRWLSNWTQALRTNVVAVWPREAPEPWLLLTDLPPTRHCCRAYRRRTWEEELFRDLKSSGWNWQRSRVRDPERVARLVLVLTLAMLWMLALGQRLIRWGRRRLLEPRRRRCLSRFRLARHWLSRAEACGWRVRCWFHFYPIVRAPLKLS